MQRLRRISLDARAITRRARSSTACKAGQLVGRMGHVGVQFADGRRDRRPAWCATTFSGPALALQELVLMVHDPQCSASQDFGVQFADGRRDHRPAWCATTFSGPAFALQERGLLVADQMRYAGLVRTLTWSAQSASPDDGATAVQRADVRTCEARNSMSGAPALTSATT